jgi:hypothetical protein
VITSVYIYVWPLYRHPKIDRSIDRCVDLMNACAGMPISSSWKESSSTSEVGQKEEERKGRIRQLRGTAIRGSLPPSVSVKSFRCQQPALITAPPGGEGGSGNREFGIDLTRQLSAANQCSTTDDSVHS